jgi:UDP:flavonoid glycosyltransferase YjiC (YdhE family)
MLAEGLDRSRYDVVFASAHFPKIVFDGTHFTRRAIESQSPRHTLARVTRGQRPWDADMLERYVTSDLRLIEEIRPDLVLGDFRQSLAVSAPLSGTPCASLINAYWSPFAVRGAFPIPEHPLVRLLGVKQIARRYDIALPLVFQHFARPINAVRRRHGLEPLGGLLETLTFGDHILYPDIPELAPTSDLPPSHHYLGTLSWSPRAALPDFWERMDHDKPLVYVTLGSSGDLRAIEAVLAAARGLPVTMLVASAGRPMPQVVPDGVWVTDFVPGDIVARRAALVICNGGSTTGYQALEQGTPVLGLPSNFDQYLAAETMVRAGAALYVRSSEATEASVRAAIERLLLEERFRVSAQRLHASLATWDARSRFCAFVEDALAPRISPSRCG